MTSALLNPPSSKSRPLIEADVSGVPVYRLSVEKYHRMIEHAILDENDPVELLEGLLIEKESPSYSPLPIFKLSVERYHRMIEFGILGEDDPVELIQGILVTKMSKNTPHSVCTRKIRYRIEPLLPKGWFLDTQEPVTTSDGEPEPDHAAVRGQPDDYLPKHPTAVDVGLLIEVADSSLLIDRTEKKQTYARANFPIYWIANLVDRQIEVYTQPSGPAENSDYAQQQIYRVGDAVPLVIDGTQLGTIPVGDLLP